jgi:hypothetical protein
MMAARTDYTGVHCTTAAMKQVLQVQGIKAPHTSEPFSEAMLLGVGGGLGAGYILWEFKAHENEVAVIVIGFRNRWNYVAEFMTKTLERLGMRVSAQEAGGTKAAVSNLNTPLDAGKPVVVWADKPLLRYHGLPLSLAGYGSHQIAVLRREGDTYVAADMANDLWRIPGDIMTEARSRVPSDKSRVLTVESDGKIDLEAAIKAGLVDCVEHLSRDSESFSLPVYKKWAKMLTDRKNKKGWHVVFAERKGLFRTLRSTYEAIRFEDTEGAGLRNTYADFLEEAAPVVKNPALKDAAKAYRDAGAAWITFAESALPASVKAFADTSAALESRYSAFKKNDAAALGKAMNELDKLAGEYSRNFPMGDKAVDALFEDMKTKLEAVYDAEITALETLKQAV